MMLSHILLALCLITTAKSQFHPDCTTPDALSKRRCCPVSSDGSECGSSSGRGSCQRSQLRDPAITDTRCNWPYQQYEEVCSCNGNYDGPDCGDCKPYYHGPTCSDYKPCVRKELRQLTAAEKKQLIDAICLAKSAPSTRWVAQTGGNLGDAGTYTYEQASQYDCMTATHCNSAMDVIVGQDSTNEDVLHRGPGFGPGHRCLLMTYERMLQQVSGNSSLCLPYWDWTKDGNKCAVCTSDLLGVVGINGNIQAPSCFAKWRTFCEASTSETFCTNNKNPPLLTRDYATTKRWPSQTDMNNCVNNWPQYDSIPYDQTSESCFRACLEGSINPITGEADGGYMHNAAHGEVGGDMGWLQRAANDPIFFFLHSNVDRIFGMWQWKHCKTPSDYPTDGVPLCQGPDDGVYPIMPRRTMRECMRTPAEWGYSYSDFNKWPTQTCSGNPQPAASPTTTTTTRTTTRSTTKKDCGFLCLLGK